MKIKPKNWTDLKVYVKNTLCRYVETLNKGIIGEFWVYARNSSLNWFYQRDYVGLGYFLHAVQHCTALIYNIILYYKVRAVYWRG